MKSNYLLLLTFIIFLVSCQQKPTTYIPKGLTKLSDEEMIERAKKGNLGKVEDVILKDEQGEIISRATLAKMTDLDEYWTTPYANAEGKVVEAIFRKATLEDKKLRAKINEVINTDLVPKIEMVNINCTDKQQILQEVYESDQAGGRQKIDKDKDDRNLSLIISLLEKCGMPTLAEVSQEQVMAVWLVIQHSDKYFMKKYLPMLEQSAKNGDIDKSMIALTKDRVLMYEGKPQIYGSQVMNGKLWDLYKPEYVNQRRREVGLNPIEEYLEMFNLKFDIPQKDK